MTRNGRLLSSMFFSKFLRPSSAVFQTSVRGVANVKRFYKSVGVAGSHGSYEVNLDQSKLKTPMRNILQVPSYPLALTIAHEWESVKEEIVPAFMHITGLAYTAIDNPSRLTKFDMAENILEFIATDTLLFADLSSSEFSALQSNEWWPLLNWFNDKYNVKMKPSEGIQPAEVTEEDRALIRRHILSYNIWTVSGLLFCCETVKSVILTLAAMDRKISAAEAVNLSRLEVNFQAEHWGRVEWGHDVDQTDLEARFAAGLLFCHLNSAQQHKVARKDDRSVQHV